MEFNVVEDCSSNGSGGYDLDPFDAVQIPQTKVPMRACRKCYADNVRNSASPNLKSYGTTYYPDRVADREIQELKVTCKNKNNGCECSDCLKHLEDHLKICPYGHSLCSDCSEMGIVHNDKDVSPGRLVTTSRKNMKDHIMHCQMANQACECGIKFSSSELSTKLLEHYHHQTRCVFSYIGCDEEEPIVPDESSDKKHQAIIVSKFVELQQSLYHVKQERNNKDVENKLMQQKLTELTEKNTILTNTIDDMFLKMKSMDERLESMHLELEHVKQNADEPQMPFVGGSVKMRREFDELKTKVRKLQEKESTVSKSIRDMNLKVQLQENKTMNGELIWKIDKLDIHMAQAKSGKMVALESAPCYTAPYQYKYCTRLCLNGDGMGRNTHISIFFVVMRSEYDDLLKWPMHKRITFEMINYENPDESITESFVSNLNSSSFQRPKNNMNKAVGCPMFISLEKFISGHFVENNSAYIKTTVKSVDDLEIVSYDNN